MATNFLFATCMYVCVIIATTFSSKLPAETNENVNSNPDWNLAMKKIEDLQRIVNIQNNRISTLEKRPIDADVQLLIQLQSTITTQNEQIFQLEERVRELEETMRDEDNQPNTPFAVGPLHESNQTNTNLIRKGIFKICLKQLN